MLDVCDRAFRLQTLYKLRRKRSCQTRVFAVALEHAAVHRIAVNVYVRRAEHHINFVGIHLTADGAAAVVNSFGIPRCTKQHSRREAARLLLIGHDCLHFLADIIGYLLLLIRQRNIRFKLIEDRHNLCGIADTRKAEIVFAAVTLQRAAVHIAPILLEVDSGSSVKHRAGRNSEPLYRICGKRTRAGQKVRFFLQCQLGNYGRDGTAIGQFRCHVFLLVAYPYQCFPELRRLCMHSTQNEVL